MHWKAGIFSEVSSGTGKRIAVPQTVFGFIWQARNGGRGLMLNVVKWAIEEIKPTALG